jgi:hypothetical protein
MTLLQTMWLYRTIDNQHFMKDKILEKEQEIKKLLEELKTNLNNGRKRYNENNNDIGYYPSLVYTSTKLKELMEYFKTEL